MTPTSLPQLEACKYADLRLLCKNNSLKAAGKRDVLFAQLVDFYGFTDNQDDFDESPAQQEVAPVKTATKKAPATKVKAVKPIEQIEEAPAASTPVKIQEKIVYNTSPGTKASVVALLATVKELQSQLTTARSSLAVLESTVAAPRSPSLKKADVIALVDDKISEYRQTLTTELEKRFATVSSEITRLEQDGESKEETLRLELVSQLEGVVDASVKGLRTELTARFSAPEAAKEQAEEPLAAPALEATASPRGRRVSWKENLEDDAPPTQSVSFPSPGSPALQAISSTPRRSSLASRKATPFKTLPVTGATTPASSLPSHMLATAASAAKRSPRTSRISSPAPTVADKAAVEPMSPAGPALKAIGKRTRDSDASELSIEVAALDSPAAEARSRTASASSVVSPGRRLSEILAELPASAKKDDGHHARKRQRVSSATAVEQQDDDEDDEEDEDFHDSFEGSEESSEQNDESFDILDDDDDAAETSVREYLVAIKTGEEEPTAVKPAPHSSVAVNDPSFFAVAPPSTSARRATLDASVSGSVKENAAPLPRKSLPMASLPVPFVSPYAASKAASTAPASASKAPLASTFSFGTPSSVVNRRITIGPAASARKATPAARANPYASAKKAPATVGAAGRHRPASFGSNNSQTSTSTPQASRTLFGSERLGVGAGVAPSSVASYATARTAYEYQDGDEQEEEDEREGAGRFGDVESEGFASALTSPQKDMGVGGWGALVGGAFGGRA